METMPVFTLNFSRDVSIEEREALLEVLRSSGAIIQSPDRERDPLTVSTIIVLIKIVGTAATTATSLIKLATAINEYKKKRQEDDKPTGVSFDHPKKQPLQLDQASYEEVEKWITHHTQYES